MTLFKQTKRAKMASEKQTTDLHTRRMFISESSIKNHKYPFYDSNHSNEKNHLKVILMFLGGLGRNQPRQRMIYPAGTSSAPSGFLYRL